MASFGVRSLCFFIKGWVLWDSTLSCQKFFVWCSNYSLGTCFHAKRKGEEDFSLKKNFKAQEQQQQHQLLTRVSKVVADNKSLLTQSRYTQMSKFSSNIFWYKLLWTTSDPRQFAISWLSKSILMSNISQTFFNLVFHWIICSSRFI